MEHISSPDKKETLNISDIINILGNDFTHIYSVICATQEIEVYRYENDAVGVRESLHERLPYEAVIQNYIKNNVLPDDRECRPP